MKIIDQTDLLNEKAESAAVPEYQSNFVPTVKSTCLCHNEVIDGVPYRVHSPSCVKHPISRAFYQMGGDRAVETQAQMPGKRGNWKEKEKR